MGLNDSNIPIIGEQKRTELELLYEETIRILSDNLAGRLAPHFTIEARVQMNKELITNALQAAKESIEARNSEEQKENLVTEK